MTRYFVLAYALFVVAFLILLGVGKYPNDNYSLTIYGYGRFAEGPTYLVTVALTLAGAWNFVQWRKTRSGLATTSIHFILANVCYAAGLLLLVGTWVHPSTGQRASVFGFGRFEIPAIYLFNFALFAIGWYCLRQWRKSGRPGVSETQYFALAYAWFILGIALFLGVAQHPGSNHHAAIYGYGKLEEFPPYLAVVLLLGAAYSNFHRWRNAKGVVPATTPAPREIAAVPTKLSWQYLALGGVAIALILAMSVTSTETKVQPRLQEQFPFDGRANGEVNFPVNEFRDPTAFIDLPTRREPTWAVMIALPVVLFTTFGLTFFAVTRMYRNKNRERSVNLSEGTPAARLAPSQATTWSRPQKRLIAGSFPVLATGIATLLLVWMFREFRHNDSHFNRILIYFIVWSIVALAVSSALYRWAYPESDSDRTNEPAPLGRNEVPATESGIGYRIILGLWFVLTPATILNICMVLITPNRYPDLPAWASVLVFMSGWMMGVGLPTFVRFLWINREVPARPLRESADIEREPKPLPRESEPVAPPPPATARTCPRCTAPIAADSPQGLCPRCLMAGAFQSILNPSHTGPYSGPFAPPTPEEVQEHFPNLEILGLIGHGGMGAVYQARQPNLDRIVALKLIRPREDNPMFAERFVREAKAMAKLTHPNIATIYESGEAGGSLYLLMEFVDGVTLREAIKSKALTPGAAMQIVGQLCDALEYAHSQGVVHRDIKPENILLDRAGKVKVVDFGLAKLADDNAMSLTHTRQAMGTPHYMAPEQWEKPTEVDHRADIYALGVVIYELLTGELPLGRFDPPSVKSRLDARIDEIVLKLLAKEPDRRYQHASEVRTALFGLGHLAVEGTVRQYGTDRNSFYEYKSETTVLGFPLVHFVRGIDPRTGRRPWARGVIAVGRKAIGVVAIGQLAIGLIAIGQLAIGLIAIGQLAFGPLLAIGQFAFSLFVGAGMFAFGTLFGAGLVSVGVFATGLVGFGRYVIDADRRDPEFWPRLSELGERILSNFSG